MRTPEETARLANGVTVETPRGSFDVHAHVSTSGRLRCDFAWATAGAGRDTGAVLAVAIADLAEARAEVATLRGHVKLLAEWQAAKRAELATPAPPDGDCSAWIKSLQGTSSVESRMLAAALPGEEVGR